MNNLMREKVFNLFLYLPLKGSTGKVGLSRKILSSSFVVKSTRKARGFVPLGLQLQL
jgi:hypothetical protein